MARFDPIGASHYHRLHGQDISRPRIWARFPTAGPARHRWGVQRTAQRKLAILDADDCREDLHCSPPSRLARITRRGEKQGGQRSLKRWCLRFRWDDGYADDVEISNYRLGVAAW